MAATDFTADDLPWDLNKWLVVDPGERATDHAIEILDDAGPAERVTLKRVLEYASGERHARAVKPNDWARVLEHADGRLALVSWSSWGVTEIGLKEDPDQRRQFDVWMFSALRDDEQRDDATSAGVSDLLRGSSPSIVPVWESHLRPEIVPDGGQSADGAERTCDHCGGDMAVISDWSADDEERGWQRITRFRCRGCGRADVKTVARDDVEIATDGGRVEHGTERREVADQPALVTHCTGCGERVGLDRHIKSIGDQYYAVCYDCSPLDSTEERQQQKLITDGGQSTDGTERYRKQAPKQSVEAPGNPPGQVHPDWFWAMSGGIDSTAAYLLTKDALHENYSKRPLMVNWDTRIGLPLNRLYLEELADTYDEMLWSARTYEKFEDRVSKRGKFEGRDDAGPPGGAQHGPVRNEVKGRQADKLVSLADHPVVVLGLRAGESDTRAEMAKVEDKGDVVEVRPVHRLSKRECLRIILRHEECPINPCWMWRHPSDCFCLANGDPSELDRVEERFPWFAQRIREYEEAAKADGWKDVLGWDGLYAVERDAKKQGQEQAKLNTCGDGCQRKQDPIVTGAVRTALVDGRGEGLAVLDGERLPVESESSDLVAATDGGTYRCVEPETDRSGGDEA
ncbi:MAG: hypothetical protein ACOCY1_05890 [Halovenus sp.]